MDLDTLIGTKVNTAIDVNGLFVPANSVTKHLREYVEPAVFHTVGMGRFNLSLSGSLVRCKYKGRFFALLSEHQVSGPQSKYDYDQLALINYSNNRLITSEGAVFQTRESDDDEHLDTVLFEFTDPVKKSVLSPNGWYLLDDDMLAGPVQKPDLVFALGYPGELNFIEYERSGYAASPYAIIGHQCAPKMLGRLAFKPEPATELNPSGMSGGAVFGVHFEGLHPRVFFGGIITNASKHIFHFVPRTKLLKYFLE